MLETRRHSNRIKFNNLIRRIIAIRRSNTRVVKNNNSNRLV